MLIPTTKESDTRWKDCVEVSVVLLPILSLSTNTNTNENENDPSVLASSKTSSSSVKTTTATATLLLQLVGLQSSTGTVFARIRQQSCYSSKISSSSNSSPVSAVPAALPVPHSLLYRVEDILNCVLLEQQRQQQQHPPAKEPEETRDGNDRNPENPPKSTTSSSSSFVIPTSTVLLELGSVWVFDPSTVDRPQNKPRWRRLQRPPSPCTTHNTTPTTTLFPVDPTMILRIHTRPARYTTVTDYFQASLFHGVGRQQSSVEVQPNKNSGSTVVTVHGQGRNNRKPQHQHRAILYEHSSNSSRNSKRFIDTTKNLGKDVHNKSRDDNTNGQENTAEGEASFAILNKPSGLPTHATVENGTENVLYQYQHYHRTRTSSQHQEPQKFYASLPQRLDTETSGLLLIATSFPFASFISKVIENKSKVVRNTNTTTTTNIHTPDLYKKYRCVVRFDSERTWKEIHTKYSQSCRNHTIMEHYVDINSNAPKTFVSILPRTPPATPVVVVAAAAATGGATVAATGAATTTTKTTMDGTTITTTEDETSEIPATVGTVAATATTPQRRRSCPKWQSCRLKILAMTTPLRIIPGRPSHSNSRTTSAASSFLPRTGSSAVVASAAASSALPPFYISEFEIELLTGRTHQIRGQLAAVGCPIIGDPLYGGGSSGCLNNTTKNNNTNNDSCNYSSRRPHTVSSSTGNNQMALQCCQLSFFIDNNNIIDQTKKKKNTRTKRDKKFSPLLKTYQNGTTSSSSYENGDDDNNNNNSVTTRNKEAKTTTTTTNSKGRKTNSSSTTYCCTNGDKPSTAILHSNNTCSSSNRSKIKNSKGPQHENKNDKEYFHFHLDSAWWSDELTNLIEQQHQQRNVRS